MDLLDFKKNVRIVEIENNSFCNRQCVYCINNYIDRFSENIVMPIQLFYKIIDELSSIDYSHELTFHRYNEPFYEKNDMILERIGYARQKLPNATLEVSTNGDYLDEVYVNSILSAGLDKLHIQIHYDSFDDMTLDKIKGELSLVNNRIGGFKGKIYTKNDSVGFVTINSGFKVLTIISTNFIKVGYPRAGIVKTTKQQKVDGPCYNPLISFPIDYNGNVCICHSTVSYCNEHSKYVIGDCNKNTIFEIYSSDNAINHRQNLLNGNRKHICMNCHGSLSNRAKDLLQTDS